MIDAWGVSPETVMHRNRRAARFAAHVVLTAVVVSLALLGGCGGGSGSSHSGGSGMMVDNTPVGTASLTASVSRDISASASVHDPGILKVTIQSINGNPTLPAGAQRTTPITLSAASGGNTTVSPAGQTSIVSIPAPAGTVIYQFDLTDTTGRMMATVTTPFVIPANASNLSLQAHLQSNVAAVTTYPPQIIFGFPFQGRLELTAYDAAGAEIVSGAPFAQPFTLTGDTSGQSTLANLTTGKPANTSVSVTGPDDIIQLTYSGGLISAYPFLASGASIPSNGGITSQEMPLSAPPGTGPFAITFTGTTLGAGSATDPNFNKPTLTLAPGETKSFTAAQAGFSDRPPNHFSLILEPSSAKLVSISSTDNLTFNVTAKAPGLAHVRVLGDNKADIVWFKIGGS